MDLAFVPCLLPTTLTFHLTVLQIRVSYNTMISIVDLPVKRGCCIQHSRNQISGPSHHSFMRNTNTFQHSSGHGVFESSLLQDKWCCGKYLPLTIANKYNFLEFDPSSKLRSNTFVGNRKHKHVSAVLAGSQKNHICKIWHDRTGLTTHFAVLFYCTPN